MDWHRMFPRKDQELASFTKTSSLLHSLKIPACNGPGCSEGEKGFGQGIFKSFLCVHRVLSEGGEVRKVEGCLGLKCPYAIIQKAGKANRTSFKQWVVDCGTLVVGQSAHVALT
eukprot:5153085-Amphidinium_carterae.3